MQSSNFFALMARMKYISRWGLMRSTTQENIQEHSLMVAMLAHALAVIRRDVLGGAADPDRCAVIAIFHDAPEILTGDLPTPVKYFNPEISASYKAVERSAAELLLSMLPEALAGAYTPLFTAEETDAESYALVKAADRLAAYIKCVEELRSGNGEFRRAAAQVRESLEANMLPEVDYFMRHFMDGFELTLDELY